MTQRGEGASIYIKGDTSPVKQLSGSAAISFPTETDIICQSPANKNMGLSN